MEVICKQLNMTGENDQDNLFNDISKDALKYIQPQEDIE